MLPFHRERQAVNLDVWAGEGKWAQAGAGGEPGARPEVSIDMRVNRGGEPAPLGR